MNNENLIPLNTRTPEEARAIQVAGGLVKSEAKALANRTKNLKTGKYAKKFTLMVQDLAKSPETSALKIFFLVEQIGENWANLDIKIRMELAKLYMEAHRTIHGQKNLNVNLNSELKDDLERWFKDGKEENKQE